MQKYIKFIKGVSNIKLLYSCVAILIYAYINPSIRRISYAHTVLRIEVRAEVGKNAGNLS